MRYEGMGTTERWEFCKSRMPFLAVPSIHPTAIIDWPCVEIGKYVYVGPGAILGFRGFSFGFNEDGKPIHMAHTGKLVIKDGVEIGSGTIVCRGTIDDTIIGEDTKIDDNCHIAHNTQIGNCTMIAANFHTGGNSRIGSYCWIGQAVTIKNRVKIADYTYLGSGAVVLKDIEEPYGVYVGVPARFLRWRKKEEISPL